MDGGPAEWMGPWCTLLPTYVARYYRTEPVVLVGKEGGGWAQGEPPRASCMQLYAATNHVPLRKGGPHLIYVPSSPTFAKLVFICLVIFIQFQAIPPIHTYVCMYIYSLQPR